MNYSYFNSFEIEAHPFGTFMPPNPKKLIVGTFPTHKRNRFFEWYYGGDGNRFWEIMETVLSCKFQHTMKNPAVLERQNVMRKHSIAMTDMVARCYRRNNLSQDHNLYPIDLTDVIEILIQNPTIETVVFTSRTRVIGALGLFETMLYQKKMNRPKFENHDGMLEGWLPLNHADISLLVPYSPSKTLAEKEFASKARLVKMYNSCSLK